MSLFSLAQNQSGMIATKRMNLLKILEASWHTGPRNIVQISSGLVMPERPYHYALTSSILCVDFYKYLLI